MRMVRAGTTTSQYIGECKQTDADGKWRPARSRLGGASREGLSGMPFMTPVPYQAASNSHTIVIIRHSGGG